MPATTPEDVLKRLVEATDEAKATLSQLHEARKALVQAERAQRRRIDDLTEKLVTEAIDVLRNEARAAMQQKAQNVIEGLAADWRTKLGLLRE